MRRYFGGKQAGSQVVKRIVVTKAFTCEGRRDDETTFNVAMDKGAKRRHRRGRKEQLKKFKGCFYPLQLQQ